MLAVFVIPLAGMKQRVQPSSCWKLFNAAPFTDIPFLIFNLGVFFSFMGVYVPFYYIQLYALQECNMDQSFSFYLLAIINASSTVGRVLPNFYADKTGPLNIQISFSFIAAMLCFCWIAVRNTAGLIIWSVVYGFFCGCFASMLSPSVMSLTSDLRVMGSRMGIALGASGFGFLIGSPIAGALLRNQGGWVSLQSWAGVSLIISGVCWLIARILKVGFRFNVKI